MPETLTIFTVGYREHSHDYLRRLVERMGAGALVVDVRRDAVNGLPQWTAGELAGLLGDAYLHLPQLGNSRDAERGKWKVIDKQAALDALAALVSVYRNGGGPVLLLCAEFRSGECHRRQVAEQLRKRLAEAMQGATVEVKHLL